MDKKLPPIKSSLLKKFSAAAAAFIAAHGLANGQVILTDPVDDTLAYQSGTNPTYVDLDINSDGKNDVRLFISFSQYVQPGSNSGPGGSTMSYTYTVFSQGINKATGTIRVITSNNYAKAFTADSLIKLSSNFKSVPIIFHRSKSKSNNFSSSGGNIKTGETKFFSIKFYDNNNIAHPAWIKIKVDSRESFIIKKWAYESTGDSIFIGTKPLYLAAKDTTADSVVIAIKPKFDGTINYVVVEATAKAPDWQQVLNGLDGDGNNAIASSSIAVTNAPDTNFVNVKNLTPNTHYIFYMVSKDYSNNQDKDVYTCEFTTKQGSTTNLSPTSDSKIKIYPNPAKNFISISGLSSDNIQVKILDLSGKELIRAVISNKSQIDISQLKPGIYSVKLTGTNYTLLRKLIKY